ncbi:MAG: fimbrillin family protein [Candidatus Cryptobacteroides sp.]
MKRLSAAGFVLGAGLSLISCSRDLRAPYSDPVEILFEAALQPNTKSLFPGEDPFLLWGFKEDGEALLEGVATELREDGLWEVPGGFFREDRSERLVFYAASPSDRAAYAAGRGVVFEDYSTGENLDLLYCVTSASLEAGASPMIVPLTFVRALATLRLNIKSLVPDDIRITLRTVRLSGVVTRGDFRQFPSPCWTPSEKDGYVFYDSSMELGDTYSEIGPGRYMIPQYSSVHLTLLCDMMNGEVLLQDQPFEADFNLSLNSGKVTTYQITVNSGLELKIVKDGL